VHMRDRSTASEDLCLCLSRYSAQLDPRTVEGALMIPCLARGEYLFGQPNHDLLTVRSFLGDDLPIAGCFGNGETGTVGCHSTVHAYTTTACFFLSDEVDDGKREIFQTGADRQQYTGSLDDDVQRALTQMEKALLTADIKAPEELPLFLLNQQLFPGCETEFHIFEPRYRLMATLCHNSGIPFGLMANSSVGTVAHITQLLEVGDGRFLLRVKADSRFRLSGSWVKPGTFGLNYGKAELFKDEEYQAEDADEIANIVNNVEALFKHLLVQGMQRQHSTEDDPDPAEQATEQLMEVDRHMQELEKAVGPRPPKAEAAAFSMWMSSAVPAPAPVKNQLLTISQPKKRLELLQQLLTQYKDKMEEEQKED